MFHVATLLADSEMDDAEEDVYARMHVCASLIRFKAAPQTIYW
jgi:hypothetical protein